MLRRRSGVYEASSVSVRFDTSALRGSTDDTCMSPLSYLDQRPRDPRPRRYPSTMERFALMLTLLIRSVPARTSRLSCRNVCLYDGVKQQDAFLDLRIDMCDRPQPSASTSKPTRSPSIKAAYVEKAKAVAAATQPLTALAPSNLPNALRRCQSASTVRKKLLNAVEQSSSQMTNEQLAALRNLAASAAKPTPKSSLGRQLASNGASSAYMESGGRPSSAATSGLPVHPQKSRSQDFSSGTPLRSKNHPLPSSEATGSQQRTTSKTVGGFKSCTVQLEVELAERLNEIERSKV